MKKSERIAKMLNDRFCETIDIHLTEKFGDCGFETLFNIVSMRVHTTWRESLPDELKLRISAYCEGFSEGYGNAMGYVGSLK